MSFLIGLSAQWTSKIGLLKENDRYNEPLNIKNKIC